MAAESIIGWDVGGAHVKAARISRDGMIERVIQAPCPLWQGLGKLRSAVDDVLKDLGTTSEHAITMTGELADLFPHRKAGVEAIVETMSDCLPAAHLHIYAGHAGFFDARTAVLHYSCIASANWRATAELVANHIPNALVLDIGSTTTDIIPVTESRVQATGTDDASRLISQELLYLGVVRTSLMALATRWPFEGNWTGICNELFASTADVYRLTGELPAGADQHPTSDGAPKDLKDSARRLARMIGRDSECFPLSAWLGLANWLKATHINRTEEAIAEILSKGDKLRNAPLVGAGTGKFLARQIAIRQGRPFVDFADMLGSSTDDGWISACAAAVSVARLALRL